MNSCRAIVITATLLAIIVLSMTASAAPFWINRPGTIAEAVSHDDGTEVYLDAVTVDKIKARQNPSYFVIKETFDSKSRIIVYAAAPAELRRGQTVDVGGILSTLPNGQRAIINPRIVGYLNAAGDLMVRGGVIKPLSTATNWQWKADLTPAGPPENGETLLAGEPNIDPLPKPVFEPTISGILADGQSAAGRNIKLDCKKIISKGTDPVYGSFIVLGEDNSSSTIRAYISDTENSGLLTRLNTLDGQVKYQNDQTVIAVDSGPDFDPQDYTGGVQDVATKSISYARTFEDGTDITIQNKRITENDQSILYVQDLDRSAGIRVVYNDTQPLALDRGATVDITGTLITNSDGERQIITNAGGISVLSPVGAVAKPIGISNKALGGGDFNMYTTGINYPAPVSELYNKGLFVKIWGKVTAIDPSARYFYIDDGSAIDNGPDKPTGVKVVWNTDGEVTSLPSVGDYLTDVIGISSSEELEPGKYARLLRIRKIATPVVTGTAFDKLVELSWDAQDHTSYNIYRSTDESGPFNLIKTVYSGSYSDNNVSNGTTYYYKVTAKTSEIEGPASAVIGLTPILVDTTPPVITLVSAPSGNNNVINFDQCVVRFKATDDISGIDGQPWVTFAIQPTVATNYTSPVPGDPYYGFISRSQWLKDWMRRDDEHPTNRSGWDPFVVWWLQNWIDNNYDESLCNDGWGTYVVDWLQYWDTHNQLLCQTDWNEPSIVTYNATYVGDDTYEVSFPFEKPGAYSVKIFAKDKAGNFAQSEVPITFSAGGFTVEWLEPLSTMETYVMEDGSTVPVKFRLRDPADIVNYVDNCLYTLKVIDDQNNVWKQVSIPEVDMLLGTYHVNVKTKDANNVDWPIGNYTIVIEGPGIWEAISGPYRSRYGVEIVEKSVAKGKGKK